MSDRDQTTPPPPPGWDPSQGHHDPTVPAPAPVKKKSWFARHKILTGILAVVAVFAVVGALGGGDDDAPGAAAQTSAESAHSSAGEGTGSSASSQGSTADESAAEGNDEAAAAEEAAAQEAAAEKEEKEAEAKAAAPGIGDVVEVGAFQVTVTAVEPGGEWIGDQTFGEAPQGQFVKVHVTVENTGSEAEYFLDSDQKLVDGQDRQHSTSSSAWLLEEESLFLAEINPGNTVEGVLLYDIPVDAVPTSLDLQAGWFDGPVRVSLEG